jgi:hypothetical protein
VGTVDQSQYKMATSTLVTRRKLFKPDIGGISILQVATNQALDSPLQAVVKYSSRKGGTDP